jgi:hypothetical protein
MHVARHLHHAVLILHHDGLVAPLKDVTTLPMRPVEATAVTHLQPMHRRAQVGFGRPDHQMIMVVHQHERMNLQAKTLR